MFKGSGWKSTWQHLRFILHILRWWFSRFILFSSPSLYNSSCRYQLRHRLHTSKMVGFLWENRIHFLYPDSAKVFFSEGIMELKLLRIKKLPSTWIWQLYIVYNFWTEKYQYIYTWKIGDECDMWREYSPLKSCSDKWEGTRIRERWRPSDKCWLQGSCLLFSFCWAELPVELSVRSDPAIIFLINLLSFSK